MKRLRLIISALILAILFLTARQGTEWYYVHHVGLRGNTVLIEKDDPLSVFLPTGHVLLFIDKLGQLGYMYFISSKYGEADYIFGLYMNGRRIERNGKFTIWRYLPFIRRKGDDAVFGDDTGVPYLSWIETGWLYFALGKIDRVSVIGLSEWESSSFSTNKVEWIKVGQPTH